VAEKEAGTDVHQQFKNVYSVSAVDRRTVYQWASIAAGSEKGQVDLSDTTVFGMEKG
jgi:alkyl sulfatase BDS1-like metallo-beta-lactamase superfamily hydrolase